MRKKEEATTSARIFIESVLMPRRRSRLDRGGRDLGVFHSLAGKRENADSAFALSTSTAFPYGNKLRFSVVNRIAGLAYYRFTDRQLGLPRAIPAFRPCPPKL